MVFFVTKIYVKEVLKPLKNRLKSISYNFFYQILRHCAINWPRPPPSTSFGTCEHQKRNGEKKKGGCQLGQPVDPDPVSS